MPEMRAPCGRRSYRRAGSLGLACLFSLAVGCGADQSGVGASAPAQRSAEGGWTLTVYYTAVERFHQGRSEQVRGCPHQECEHGTDDLGTYPADFVRVVRDEGTGRITSGAHRGGYLNWSYDTGFWLDTVPADTTGVRLEPFSTAAADATALPRGSVFTIVDCGAEDDGSRIDPASCDRLRRSTWTVRDEFTPGLGGARHIDLYIGEEDRAGFTDNSPLYLTAVGARIALVR